jgi:uncharacterized cupredoxin-like copper-binding protein
MVEVGAYPTHRYPYICTVTGHAAAGMKGVFTVR